jgi:exonuclease SbcD
VVLSVEVTPTTPATITDIPLTSCRHLRTIRGTVAEILARASEFGEDYLRVYVREAARAGLREEIEEALPNAVQIRIDEEFAAPKTVSRPQAGPDRTPGELFADYCGERNVDDPRVRELFDRLHDEASSAQPTV